MASAALTTNSNPKRDQPCTVVAPHAVVILIAGMIAAWLAAGSTGLLAHSLQRALTWSALAMAVLAAWPRNSRSPEAWIILAGSAALGLFFTISSLPTLSVLGVVIVLAGVAQATRGLTHRVAIIVALAAGALAVCRFAYDCIPTAWVVADLKGWLLGRFAGWLVGAPLEVGATFGGLDFLVVMAVVYVGWLLCTPPPRCRRAIWGAIAIVACHFAYLAALAYSEKLLAMLPDMVLPPNSDSSRVGVWTVGNGLRMLLPWNVPLLAVAIDAVIVAVMFRSASWLPVVEPDPLELRKQEEEEAKKDIPGSALAADVLFRFGPSLLAIVATLAAALGANRTDLKGKTVLAYEKGYLNWQKPEFDLQVDGYYGMLPTFVESLGGRFVKSPNLSDEDLKSADVLVLLHPDEPWSDDMLKRIWDYVERGGSLLLVADPVIRDERSSSSFNEVLQPTAMRVRYDTAVTRTGNWEQSYQPLAHPVTAGIDDARNRFGFELGSSIRTRWPARPVLVGRWGWSDPGSDAVATGASHYNAGEPLGDLVLAAEQPIGQGRVFVLGNTSPLRNEMLANSFPFAGRLLGYLANRPASPQALWRQALSLLAIVGMCVLVALRPAAWQLIVTSTVMAISLTCCTALGRWSGEVLPDGRPHETKAFNRVAYIDASHLEAYSSDFSTPHGIAGLLRTLMRDGYLPLLAPDLSPKRLQGAGLLISIAPAREFDAEDREAVNEFVAGGGTFICMAGAEEVRAVAPLLADFDFTVPPSPVPPGERTKEPEPLGAFQQIFGKQANGRYVQFFAGWPLECTADHPTIEIVWSDGQVERPVVVGHSDHGGSVVVIADTYFAANENLETSERVLPDNIRFWRWLLSNVVPGQKPWTPPPAADREKSGSPQGEADDEPEQTEETGGDTK